MRLRAGTRRPSPTRPACSPGSRRSGLRICLWINPYIAQRSSLFAEGRRHGYLLRKRRRRRLAVGPVAGRDGARRLHQPGRPRWYPTSCAPCWTWASTASRPTSASGSRPTSCGPTAPTRSGCTTTTPTCTTKAVFELLEQPPRRRRGDGVRPLSHRRRPAVPGPLGRGLRVDVRRPWRRACAADCRWPCPASASGATTSAASRARPDPAVFKRWIPFGLLSIAQPAARQRAATGFRGCSTRSRSRCSARFTQLKMQLMPYLFGQAVAAHQTGMPVLRPMAAGVPRRPGLHAPRPAIHARRPLLVAPVFTRRGDVVLPAGRHVDPSADRRHRTRSRLGHEVCDFATVPVYVRPGSVLPLGARERPAGLRVRRRHHPAGVSGARRGAGHGDGARPDGRGRGGVRCRPGRRDADRDPAARHRWLATGVWSGRNRHRRSGRRRSVLSRALSQRRR